MQGTIDLSAEQFVTINRTLRVGASTRIVIHPEAEKAIRVELCRVGGEVHHRFYVLRDGELLTAEEWHEQEYDTLRA